MWWELPTDISGRNYATVLRNYNVKDAALIGNLFVQYEQATSIAKQTAIRKKLVPLVCKDPVASYYYAIHILGERFKQGEKAISTCSNFAYAYANRFGFRFEAAEKAIASNAKASFWYACYVLKDRFPLGEPKISQDPWISYLYARDVIKGPFEAAHGIIATNAQASALYAKDVLGNRFPPGEGVISGNSLYRDLYENAFNIKLTKDGKVRTGFLRYFTIWEVLTFVSLFCLCLLIILGIIVGASSGGCGSGGCGGYSGEGCGGCGNP